jgi:hypothetical protein
MSALIIGALVCFAMSFSLAGRRSSHQRPTKPTRKSFQSISFFPNTFRRAQGILSYRYRYFIGRILKTWIFQLNQFSFDFYKLLRNNPLDRISLQDLRKHSWVQQYADKSNEYMKYYKEEN